MLVSVKRTCMIRTRDVQLWDHTHVTSRSRMRLTHLMFTCEVHAPHAQVWGSCTQRSCGSLYPYEVYVYHVHVWNSRTSLSRVRFTHLTFTCEVHAPHVNKSDSRTSRTSRPRVLSTYLLFTRDVHARHAVWLYHSITHCALDLTFFTVIWPWFDPALTCHMMMVTCTSRVTFHLASTSLKSRRTLNNNNYIIWILNVCWTINSALKCFPLGVKMWQKDILIKYICIP